MQSRRSDEPSGSVLKFTPRPRRDPSDGKPLSYTDWRLLRGRGDAAIELDATALSRWFGVDPQDAAVRCADLLPAGGSRRADDADQAVKWWQSHVAGLLERLIARGVPKGAARKAVAGYTVEVRGLIDAIHAAHRSAEDWEADLLVSTIGLSAPDDPPSRPRGKSGNGR